MANLETLSQMTGLAKPTMRRGRHATQKKNTGGVGGHEQHNAALQKAMKAGDMKGVKSSALNLAKAAHRSSKAGGC